MVSLKKPELKKLQPHKPSHEETLVNIRNALMHVEIGSGIKKMILWGNFLHEMRGARIYPCLC
jgi:hypothetical protein